MNLTDRYTKLPDGNIALELTDGQSTPLGKIVGHLLYHNRELYSLCPSPIGCPSTGGQHSLRIRGSMDDVKAFIDLMIDFYSKYKSLSLVEEGIDALWNIKKMLIGKTGL